MPQERPENSYKSEYQPENAGILQSIVQKSAELCLRAGLSTVKLFTVLLLCIAGALRTVAYELKDMLRGFSNVCVWLFRYFTESLRKRHKKNIELQKAVQKAKKQDKRSYMEALSRFILSYLFGEGGVFYTAFNYIMPIVSFAFLIGVIKYGAGLEYGISVEFNGKNIGIISEESEYDRAEKDVLQRISYNSDGGPDLSAKFSLKIINEEDRLLNTEMLANKMLEASDEELTEAYGIYIDGQFIGAVTDKDPIQEALDERLLNFDAGGKVKDVDYQNKIEYTQGIYLSSSILDQQETIDKLTSSVKKRGIYVTRAGDSLVSICQKYNMDPQELRELNPLFADQIKAGQIINITETESYLPIKYVVESEMLSLLDYETIEVETSALNVGMRQVLVKGAKGEKHTNYEITYIDGIERSRKVISSQVTRDPITEQIGVGIYSAHPDSPNTLLTGSGEFGWPVNGGYISDPYMSDRNHKGLDIAAPGGTEIYAAADGVVISAGWNSGGYGNVVQIAHDNGYQTVYGHMSTVLVTVDQEVHRGQLIGLVGTTGNSTGNHCHFEVRYLGVCKNPANYLNTTDFAASDKKKNEDDD